MEWLLTARWSPYIAGFGIGVLIWLTFLFSDKPIGCSTAFARTSGMLEKIFRGRRVDLKPYYQQFKPVVDWEWMLVLGIVPGAFISAFLSGDFHWQWVPGAWGAVFGPSIWIRLSVAFLGGVFLGFGSRWAGGCTSGHGISGTSQLALGSWIASICFFIGGIGAAFLIYHVIGG